MTPEHASAEWERRVRSLALAGMGRVSLPQMRAVVVQVAREILDAAANEAWKATDGHSAALRIRAMKTRNRLTQGNGAG